VAVFCNIQQEVKHITHLKFNLILLLLLLLFFFYLLRI
jgi:hypothetical protein